MPNWARSLSSMSPKASHGQTTAVSEEKEEDKELVSRHAASDLQVLTGQTAEWQSPPRPSIPGTSSNLRREGEELSLYYRSPFPGIFPSIPSSLPLSPSIHPSLPHSLPPHTHPFCPALGALLLNCLLSFCLNFGGVTLLASEAAAFMAAGTRDVCWLRV